MDVDKRDWAVALCFATVVAIGMTVGIAAKIKEETIPPEVIGRMWLELGAVFCVMIVAFACLAHICFEIYEKRRRKSQNN